MVGDDAPGTVYVAEVPFENGTGRKRRPVVPIGNPSYWGRDVSVVICPITAGPTRAGDVALDWRAATLLRPSQARPRPRTIARAQLHWPLGTLTESDFERLRSALRYTLDLG